MPTDEDEKKVYYHVVFTVWRGRPALVEEIEAYTQEVIARIAAERQYCILAIETMPDHVHMLIAKAPWEDLSDIVRHIKGATARYVFLRFPDLRIDMKSNHLWTRGFRYTKHDDASLPTVMAYIKNQKRNDVTSSAGLQPRACYMREIAAQMPRNGKNGKPNGRQFATQQGLDAYIKSICDIMRRSNCAGALQYVPELTWILFLRILDEREAQEAEEAEALGVSFTPSLEEPYRWRDWGAPEGMKRVALQMGTLGAYFSFVNGELLPYLKGLKERPNASARQKVISEIMGNVERVRIDTEKNFLDVLDKVQEISSRNIDRTHIFALSQVYEGLLLKMGEKGNDGGQFFTPREVIRTMVQAIDPRLGEQVYDPCCGTGGFLAQAYEHMEGALGAEATGEQIEALKRRTLFGREKENLIFPIALANLVLHGVDQPNLWHGNTLTGQETYGGLFLEAPGLFDVVLTNPPFGGKEGKEAQTRFAYKTSATQVLFLQHVIDSLKPGGRCGIVIDEGVLFRTNETAFVQTKRRLLDSCDLWCIVSLPAGVFTAAGAGVKTNLLFFTKGKHTESVWYYDCSDIKVGKKTPFTREKLGDFFALLLQRADSERSWTVSRKEIEARGFDLKAVNPNAKGNEDTRTPEELLDLIEAKGREVADALAELRGMSR